MLGVGSARAVDRVPRDNHSHDRGLAGAGGHLAREAKKAGIGFGVRVFDLLAEALGIDFCQPDERLGRFALTEEQLALAVLVAPMQQQALRLWSDAPLARWQLAPLIDMLADFIDEYVCGDAVFKLQFALPRTTSARRRHWHDLNAVAPIRQFFSGRLALVVQFVMP